MMLELLLLVAGLGTAATSAEATLPPLVPRATFFAGPGRIRPQLSPDGQQLAWLQADDNGVLQIWTKAVNGDDTPHCRTRDPKHGIRHYFWAYNGDLLYFQDHDGDESYALYDVGHADSAIRELTPVAGIRPVDVQLSRKAPSSIMVLRGRPRRRARTLFGPPQKDLFDPWVVDLGSGAFTQADENPGDAESWVADSSLVARARIRSSADGKSTLEARDSREAPWHPVLSWEVTDALEAIAISRDGKHLYVLDNIGSDTRRLDLLNLTNGRLKHLAADPSSDVDDYDITPSTQELRAVSFDRSRVHWKSLSAEAGSELTALSKVDSGDLLLVSTDDADRRRLVSFDHDSAPGRYYLWDRTTQKATLLWATLPALEKVPLSTTQGVEIKARDGLLLPSYLTLPRGATLKNLPAVVFVHGGPWIRDTWGYDGDVQWLANRGYAVLQVNYRGSTGFGKKFKNAAMKQFAQAMHTDLLDAVLWAVGRGVVDPKRVAIMGDSYGGYAALVGMTFSPGVFACGVDMFGPSNLATLIQSFPPYWGPLLSTTWFPFVGDPRKPADRKDMEARSPLFKADQIRAPLLIGQGGNDPRVPQRESEQMVSAIEKAGGAVTYVLYPDEGHGFVRPENRIDFLARTEGFLATCLGGRAEPFANPALAGSSAHVKVVPATSN